ncbi:MAG: hypothetical protein HQL07_18685 [Nitrospirae bacterium]|nr:hypothetical protein [Magnetococcales bacterium]
MATLMEVKDSDFDESAFRRRFRENHGSHEPITTEGILEGWETVKTWLDDEYVQGIKRSPLYVSPKKR